MYKFATKEHMPIIRILRKDAVKLVINNLKILKSAINQTIEPFIIKRRINSFVILSFRCLLLCISMKFHYSNYSFDDNISLVKARYYFLLVHELFYSITDDIKLSLSRANSTIIHFLTVSF